MCLPQFFLFPSQLRFLDSVRFLLQLVELCRCVATSERTARGWEISRSKLAHYETGFFLRQKLIGIARWPSSLRMLIRSSSHNCSPIRRAPLECKNEYLVLVLGEETEAQAVVGSIVWAFRWLKEPSNQEMSARGFALHSVCPNFPF